VDYPRSTADLIPIFASNKTKREAPVCLPERIYIANAQQQQVILQHVHISIHDGEHQSSAQLHACRSVPNHPYDSWPWINESKLGFSVKGKSMPES